MTEARPFCRSAEACKAKTLTKHCAACTLSAKWADPEFRSMRAAAFKAALKDPELRLRHCEASAARLAIWRAQPGNQPGANENSRANLLKANTTEGIAARKAAIWARAYAGIPAARHEEVRNLARRMPASEAKRIIMEDERAKTRRQLIRVTDEMRAKETRRKAQAY